MNHCTRRRASSFLDAMSSSSRPHLPIAIDGSTFDIEALTTQTVRSPSGPGDTVFLLRIQGPSTSTYDDHLLKIAHKTCAQHQVPCVEILIHADSLKPSHVVDTCMRYAASIHAALLIMGKNDTRGGESNAADVALRRHGPPLMCVNFAPELTRAPDIDA